MRASCDAKPLDKQMSDRSQRCAPCCAVVPEWAAWRGLDAHRRRRSQPFATEIHDDETAVDPGHTRTSLYSRRLVGSQGHTATHAFRRPCRGR